MAANRCFSPVRLGNGPAGMERTRAWSEEARFRYLGASQRLPPFAKSTRERAPARAKAKLRSDRAYPPPLQVAPDDSQGWRERTRQTADAAKEDAFIIKNEPGT